MSLPLANPVTLTPAFLTRTGGIEQILHHNNEEEDIRLQTGLGDHIDLIGRGSQKCCYRGGCHLLLVVL
jgi:hypothetical protein